MNILGYEIVRKKAPISAQSKKRGMGGRNPSVISIVKNFKDQSSKDIADWRKALILAEQIDTPMMSSYYDLLENIMTDGHLQSQLQLRKTSTINTEFHIVNRRHQQENSQLTELFQSQWFFLFLEHAFDSFIYGSSVIEFEEFQPKNILFNLLPRRNTVAKKKRIIPDLSNAIKYISYDNKLYDDWILTIGDVNNSYGIINNVIPNIIWIKNVMQSWAEFCERFGLPLITAECNTKDPTVLDQVNKMLISIGEAGVASLPLGTKVNYHEANRTDAYNVYKQFLQTNSDVISKQLVGSTMLSDQGSNRSQTEVHERSLDQRIAQSDKRAISFIINNQLLPLLQRQGYSISEEDSFAFKTAKQEMSPESLWKITNELLSQGYQIKSEWISKTFNIPLEEKKKSEPPKGINADFSLTASKEGRYGFHCSCGEHTAPISESWQWQVDALCQDLIRAVHSKGNYEGIVGKLVAEEGNYFAKALRNNFKATSQYTGPDLLALQLMEYNLFEFSESKTEARLASIQEHLIDPKTQQIRSFSDFQQIATKGIKKYNSSWLRTEYNLSIAVGQTSAQYYRYMAQKDTATSFVKYQTAGDSQVRSAHQVLNNKIFNLNDAEAMSLWPPNGYGCRCEMIQHLKKNNETVTKGEDAKNSLKATDKNFNNSQFDINRANLKKVFTTEQFYSNLKGLPEKLDKRTYDKYKLKPYSSFKDTLKPLKLDGSITKKNLGELWKPVKDRDYMGFSDYLDRKMTMTKKTFDHHTKGYYLNDGEQRHRLFPHIKNILNNPDEVWLSMNNNVLKKKYVRFYKDRTIVIRTQLNAKEKGLNIETWYSMKKEEKETRNGLLIKKK